MLALTFPETKAFMSRLLLSPVFDRFLLVEAQISTGVTISIDGHFLKDFYTEEELEEKEYADSSFSYWEHLRPVCLNLIKGKKTPLVMLSRETSFATRQKIVIFILSLDW